MKALLVAAVAALVVYRLARIEAAVRESAADVRAHQERVWADTHHVYTAFAPSREESRALAASLFPAGPPRL